MSKLKNVIIVNDFAYIDGGASKVALTSAIELKKRGFNVILFSAVGPVMEEIISNNIQVVCTNQFDVLNDVNRFRALLQGLWNTKSYKYMNELLDKLDANETIIHIHTWTKALSSSIIKAIIKRKFRVVFTLHDYFTICPNGGLYNYKINKICRLTPMSRKCVLCNCDSRHYYHKVWRVLRQYIQNNKGLLLSGVKNYIYISEMSKNILKDYLPKEAKFYNVKNPIEIEKKDPVKVDRNNTFIYIGRLSPEKGCLLFAEATKEANCNAIFVGDGKCKDDIKRIYPEVQITGWVSKSEVENYLNKARALVFPSLLYETLGMTVLEAKAKGIPVIVSDESTGRELIEDKVTGLWFKRNNKNDLIKKISMFKDNELVKDMGKNGYNNYWNNHFSMNNHLKMLTNCYYDILNN